MSNDLFIPHYDDTELQRQLITLAREKKTTVGAQIIAASRRICANLAYQTEPMGNDDTAKIVGQNAVERDIKKVYARASDAYGEIRVTDEKAARAFYSAMMQGRTDRATKILMNSKSRWRNVPIQKFTPQTHKDARRNGKVYKKIPVSIVIMGDPLDKYIVRMKKRTLLSIRDSHSSHSTAALSGLFFKTSNLHDRSNLRASATRMHIIRPTD